MTNSIDEDGIIPTAESLWIKLLGPNYKVRRSGIAKIANEWILILAIAPYTLGAIADLIPPWMKTTILILSLIAKSLLSLTQTFSTKQKDIEGGNIIQNPHGDVIGVHDPKEI